MSELKERMTMEELLGWGYFFEYKHEKEKEAMDKAQRRR